VLIHDGVRPFASLELITATWEGARATGASIAAVPATDTVKRARDGVVSETLLRDEIWLVQTPQVFRKEIILAAYDKAVESGWSGTDDASFVERIGVQVSVVRGERSCQVRPRRPGMARWFLSGKAKRRRLKRVGFGYDVARAVRTATDPGGIEVPHELGLFGPSVLMCSFTPSAMQ